MQNVQTVSRVTMPIEDAYLRIAGLLNAASDEAIAERSALRLQKPLDASCPASVVYALELALSEAKNLRAHVEEYAK